MERVSKLASHSVSQNELETLLDILGNLSKQIEMLEMKEIGNVSLHECLLDNIEICFISEESHATKYLLQSLPRLKEIY